MIHKGVLIPTMLLREAHLSGEVELEVQDGQILIRSLKHPRQGWEESFAAMAEHGDDRLLDQDSVGGTRWDGEEWEW